LDAALPAQGVRKRRHFRTSKTESDHAKRKEKVAKEREETRFLAKKGKKKKNPTRFPRQGRKGEKEGRSKKSGKAGIRLTGKRWTQGRRQEGVGMHKGEAQLRILRNKKKKPAGERRDT